MSIFNGKRLTNKTFKLDIERMRRGWYSDKYFETIGRLLTEMSRRGYRFEGRSPRALPLDPTGTLIGEMRVEMQWFTRREPFALVAGVDKALTMLRYCAGHFDENGAFVETWQDLEVEAVQDGVFAPYDGNPLNVRPVLKVRGRLRDFCVLETPTLGILSRASRIATNVYNVLRAARGKPVLFFPARFDVHEVQAADGYAYDIAVQRFNQDYGHQIRSFVSTDAQGDWWGGAGGGTVPHAVIATFLGDTTAAMLAFAETQPPEVARVALVDFENDCVGTSLAVVRAYWERYRALLEAGQNAEAQRYVLFGVRLDTSGNMRDRSIVSLGMPELDLGVNPRLVTAVREALDDAWQDWDDLDETWLPRAQAFCRQVRIVVSGGFNPEKIKRFEKLAVPVDIYAVGSSLMSNDAETNTDFTADVVRVCLGDQWVPMAKVGRAAADNPDLEPVDLSIF